MPWGLERWHGGHDLHFITFSCYRRQALLSNVHRRELFLKVLEDVRRRYQWVVIGYVVMPEPPQPAQRRRWLGAPVKFTSWSASPRSAPWLPQSKL